MLIADAQRDSRTVYVGGFVGQLVSSIVWFASAVVAEFVDPVTGFWTLAVGGAAIFPLTQALLRMSGRPTSLAPGNPLRGLAIQVAFTVPITLPVAGAAALNQRGWFYPACLIIVGAHYLPFVFLYGMRTFAGLAAALDLRRIRDWHAGAGARRVWRMGRRRDPIRVCLRVARCAQVGRCIRGGNTAI